MKELDAAKLLAHGFDLEPTVSDTDLTEIFEVGCVVKCSAALLAKFAGNLADVEAVRSSVQNEIRELMGLWFRREESVA